MTLYCKIIKMGLSIPLINSNVNRVHGSLFGKICNLNLNGLVCYKCKSITTGYFGHYF